MPAYHVDSRFPNRRYALLLDTVSVGNQTSNAWAQQKAVATMRVGLKAESDCATTPLQPNGVGRASAHNCTLPVTLLNCEGATIHKDIHTKHMPQSQLPALLGLATTRARLMVIDTVRHVVYMVGLGSCSLRNTMPTGAQYFQCILGHAGHVYATMHRVCARSHADGQPQSCPATVATSDTGRARSGDSRACRSQLSVGESSILTVRAGTGTRNPAG